MSAAYPEEILPKSTNVATIDIDGVVSELNEVYVVRRISSPVEDNLIEGVDGERVLDIDCLDDSIVKLSVNLLGGRFTVASHLKWRQLSKGSKDWDKKSDIDINDYNGCHESLPSSHPLYYSSRSFHRNTENVTLTFTDSGAFSSYRSQLTEKAKEECMKAFKDYPYTFESVFEIFLKHSPNNLNYWHTQVEVKPELSEDEMSFKNNKSWRAEIYAQWVCDKLSKDYVMILPDPLPAIPEKFYVAKDTKENPEV